MSKTVPTESAAHFDQLRDSSRIVVVEFYADGCETSKVFAPHFERLSTDLSRPDKITFTTINTDKLPDIAQRYSVTATPTFFVFESGSEPHRVEDNDPKALVADIMTLIQTARIFDSPSAEDSSSARWIGASLPKGYTDVTVNVDLLNLDFLNLSSEAAGPRSIFTSTAPSALSKAKAPAAEIKEKDWIESDTDEQLMLYIPFQATLKLHTIHLTSIPSPTAGDEQVTRPASIRLYTNKSNVLSFDEADSIPATQIVDISPADWDPKTHTAKLDLRFVKFQNCTSIVVFVQSGEDDGAEKVRLDRIRFIGETGEKRTMGALGKIDV